jgi:serine/threonine-protein kinase
MASERTIGNYILGEVLGRGGMSEVRAARHRFLGDRVAIKLLRAHLARDPEAVAAFVAEATRNRAIAHPNVVRVIDFGSDGDDCYLVMELVPGESLAARLERTPRLDETRLRALGAAIADGVAAAHDRGIVHRDLKPGNIMLAGDTPKIVDFGIARTFGGPAAAVTGSRIGTLAYMAPEQITGGLVAPCIDVWALGVILYEALTGRLPFEGFANGRTPQLFEPAPRLATLVPVSPGLEALIAACLDRDPGRRPPSMHAIADELRRPAGDERVTEPLAPSPRDDTHAVEIEVRDVQTGARDASRGGERSDPASARRRRPARATVGIAGVAIATALVVAAAWALRAGAPQPAMTRMTDSVVSPPAGGTTPVPGSIAAVTPSPAAGTIPSPGSIASETPPPAAGTTPLPGTVTAVAPSPTAGTTSRPAAIAAATPPSSAKRPRSFTVELRSAPAGAKVIIAGRSVGTTPTAIVLDAPAAILVTRAGYRSSRVRAERNAQIDIRLVPIQPPRAAGETLD